MISFHCPKRLYEKKIRAHPSQLGNPLTSISSKRFIDSIRVYQDASRSVSLFPCAIYFETWYQNVHTWKELSRCHHDESNGRVIPIAWTFVMETSGEDENETLDFWRDWDLSNLTETEYLNKVLGPRYLPLRLVIPLTIAYLLIFVAGVFGNIVTCTVIVRNASMQTATNYYLFSLAISDLTLLMLGKRINDECMKIALFQDFFHYYRLLFTSYSLSLIYQ